MTSLILLLLACGSASPETTLPALVDEAADFTQGVVYVIGPMQFRAVSGNGWSVPLVILDDASAVILPGDWDHWKSLEGRTLRVRGAMSLIEPRLQGEPRARITADEVWVQEVDGSAMIPWSGPEKGADPPPFMDPLAAFRIQPGVAVGPIRRKSTPATLSTQLGSDALRDAPVPIGEGMTQPGTKLFVGTDEELHVAWNEDRTAVDHVLVVGKTWTLPNGLSRGADWTAIEAALGSFQLYGFDFDYGGTVALDTTTMSEFDGLLVLRLGYAPGAMGGIESERVTGDRPISSELPELDALAPTLDEIRVRFDRK